MTQTSTQTGQVVMWIARDTVTAAGGFSDSRNFAHRDLILSNTGTYTFGSLTDGVTYYIRAFRDTNYDKIQDSFEDFGSTITFAVVEGAMLSPVDIVIAGAVAPPTPGNFNGVAISSYQVQWTWLDVSGETGYVLKSGAGATLVLLGKFGSYIEVILGREHSRSDPECGCLQRKW